MREWEGALAQIAALPPGGTVMLVGGIDRGKTTFAAWAAQELARTSERIAVVDTDIGQSEIGPPGVVGAAWARPEKEKLRDLKVSARFFAGAFAPPPVALELVTASAQAVLWARRQNAQKILVDTGGYVAGPGARRIKTAKAQAVRPDVVVAFEKEGELGGLLATMEAATGAALVRVQTPPEVGKKSPALRATRRQTRLGAALTEAREIVLPLSGLSTVGATLGTGDPLPLQDAQWAASALRLPIVYGEQATGDGLLTLYTTAPPRTGWENNAGPITAHFRASSVRVLSLPAHENIYIGLGDNGGRLLSVGRFLHFHPERGEVIVSAPPPADEENIRLLQFGRVRVKADGTAGQDVRPGEV